MKQIFFTLLLLVVSQFTNGQDHNFRIRTITAGVNLSDLSDTTAIRDAITFLKLARTTYTDAGYEVQTIRVATQNLSSYLKGKSLEEAIPFIQAFDRIASAENVEFSIGSPLAVNTYDPRIANWAVRLIQSTTKINFNLSVSSQEIGLHPQSIKAAAEITSAISKNSAGGEGNFRFTASANCPPGSPFFPAAYHAGKNAFAIGLESPNVLTEVFQNSDWDHANADLKKSLEAKFKPIEQLALQLSRSAGRVYSGIDTSPAPGLDASIGEAIETLTKQPFGGPSTLRACALITDVLKNLKIKTCGYSGLMLPIIEDITLAKRADENRFTVQELLLFSSVSGTGLDVVPLPGNTSIETLERIYYDVAALSLKYINKALSARLFLIPGKMAGDHVDFDNPHLTGAKVMAIE
jgi:uncharacterized protein (UPF0210 family)